VCRVVPELYFGPELSEIRFPGTGTGTFFQFRPEPELFTKKFKKLKIEKNVKNQKNVKNRKKNKKSIKFDCGATLLFSKIYI